MDTVSLTPTQVAPDFPDTISLQGGSSMNIPSPETAADRSAKAFFSVGKATQKPYEDFYSAIANGKEDDLRKETAANIDMQKAQKRQNLLTSVIAQSPDAASLVKDQKFMSQLTGRPEPSDPKSIMEDYYGGEYLRPMWDFTDLSDKYPALRQDKQEAGQAGEDAVNHGMTNLSYKQYALKRLQQSIDNYKNQSWLGWGVDRAKDLSQIYTEIKQRGFSGDWSDLLGNSLEKERLNAYNLPPEEYRKLVDDRMDQLDKDNPGQAIQFGAAMVGQSYEDIRNNNATTLTGLPSDVANIAGVGMALNRIRGAVQGAVRSSSLMDDYLFRLKNIDDQLKNPLEAEIVKPDYSSPRYIAAAKADGHGDAAGAAVQTTAQDIQDKFTNHENPLQQVVKTLPDLFKTDIDAIDKNTGNLGQEIANRIKQETESRAIDVRKALQDIGRVNRTPVLTASEDLAKALETWVHGKYSGANSTVMNMGRELTYDPPSNTYHVALDIGTHDAQYFTDEAQAISHAETYGMPLQQPATSTRRYWDDKVTSINFEVEHTKQQLKRFDNYGKTQFKPAEYYKLQNQLKDLNRQKKSAWANRAGAFWQPNKPIAEKLGTTTLEKQGLGWFIRSWVPIDETQPAIRDALLKMPGAWSGSAGGYWSGLIKGQYRERKGTLTPYLIDPVTGTVSTRLHDTIQIYLDSFTGLANENARFLHGIRSPDETLSPEENIQRKTATFGPKELADKLFQRDTQIIQDLNNSVHLPSKRVIKDFQRVLTASQNMPTPGSTTGDHGHFVNNIGDLEHFYNSYIGRLPTDKEVSAYFAYTRMYETERALRTVSMYRNMARLGVQEHVIGMGGNRFSPPFHGVILEGLPPSGGGSVYSNLNGVEKVTGGGSYSKDITEGVATGKYKAIELWNREEKPFHKISNSIPYATEPRYAITDNLTTRPVDPNKLVPRRGGGHWVFPYNHYLRQAKVYQDAVTGEWIYKGDVTLMPFQNRALGQRIGYKFNYIKNLLEMGEEDEARDFAKGLGIAGLDYDKDVLPMFRGKDARFNFHEPFVLTNTDQTVMGMSNDLMDRYTMRGGLRDTTRSGNMSRSHVVKFTGERDAWDLHTVEDKGTAKNPVYNYKPAELLDPIDSLNRSITQISNSVFLDDMKYFSSEHWYQTYKNWLVLDRGGSPFYHFANPTWKPGTPFNVRKLAMSNRKKAMDFVNMPSSFQSATESIMNHLASSIYESMGAKAHDFLVPITRLPLEKNPIRAANTLTFDLKLGLGAPSAFFTQVSTFANIWALGTKYAPAATRSMFYHQWLRLIPQHVDYLDDLMSHPAMLKGMTGAYVWKPGQFKTLWEIGNKTSAYFQVGGEHAMQDTALQDRYMRNSTDSVRYWGRTLFREGAQAVRIGSWYTAGAEWYDLNPGKSPTSREAIAWIQNRASFYDHDMNRSSNSAVNSGIMNIPAKFFTYFRNLAEIHYGKRATWQQKARLFAVSSLIAGLPAGGIALFGVPNLDDIYRKVAMNNGYVVGENGWSLVNEGLPAYMLAAITGGGDTQKGTWMDFSKFGPGEWGPIKNALAEDPTIWRMLGAMPSTMHNTVARMHPLWQDMYALMHQDWDNYNPTIEDFTDLFKEWKAFSDFTNMWGAIHSGVWMSNNNVPLANVNIPEAVTMGITGMRPSQIFDMNAKFSIMNDRKDFETQAEKEIQRNWNLALKSRLANPDVSDSQNGYTTYMRKIKTLVSMLPEDRRGEVLKQVYSRDKTLSDSIEWNLGHKGATQADQQRFKTQMEIDAKRKGQQ